MKIASLDIPAWFTYYKTSNGLELVEILEIVKTK